MVNNFKAQRELATIKVYENMVNIFTAGITAYAQIHLISAN